MSGFNFSINSTPQSNNISKLNTAAATSTPFNFGSSGSFSSTPATNLFGNAKSNSSFSIGSVQNTNSVSSVGGLNFLKDQKDSSKSSSTAESKPLISNGGQSLFASSSLTSAITGNKTNIGNQASNPAQNLTSTGLHGTLDSNNKLSNPNSGNTNSNTLNATSNFNLSTNSKSNELSSLNTENKQKRGTGFELAQSNGQSAVNNSSCRINSENDSKQNISQSISSAGTLPNVLSFNVPSLNSPKQESKSFSETKTLGLGGVSNVRGNSTISSQTNKSISNPSKPLGIKDQQIPQILMECIEEFKKNLEEMRKIKELNSTYTSKIIHQNMHEILTIKQCITQSQTESQRNFNEVANLKENITQELRNVDICDHLKDMPLGLQYDYDIWNEYFMSRVRLFQNKLRNLKNQFEQLEGYFKVHDEENMIESQRIVETLKASHKNLLNEASMLKIVHEKVQELKTNFLMYRKSCVGDTTNIFENCQNGHYTLNINNSLIKNVTK